MVNKKFLLILIFAVLLLVPMVSAEFEVGFDNVIGEYNETTKEVTITNTFGLGGDIATMQLITARIDKPKLTPLEPIYQRRCD